MVALLAFMRLIAVFFIFACLYSVLRFAGNGLDFTDSAYYVSWATYPVEHRYSLTWFGQITSLILRLAGGDLKIMSIIGILVLFLFGTAVTLVLFLAARKQPVPFEDRLDTAILAAAGGCGFLTYYSIWILIPSYNWLSLVSAILVIIGLISLLLVPKQGSWRVLAPSAIAIALGLWLTLFAKFTNTLAQGLLGLTYLTFVLPGVSKTLKTAIISVAAFLVLTLVFHWGVRPLDALIADTVAVHRIFQEVGSDLSILKTLDKNVEALGKIKGLFRSVYAIGFGALSAIVLTFVVRKHTHLSKFAPIGAAACLSVVLFLIYREELWNVVRTILSFQKFIPVVAFSWSAWVTYRLINQKSLAALKRNFGLGALLLGAAYAMQFGSQNDLRVMANLNFGLFFLIAAVPWFSETGKSPSIALPSVIVSLLLLHQSVNAWPERPYRMNTPASEQNTPIDAKRLRGIRFDKETALALQTFRAEADKAQLRRDDLVIDMTGASPYIHLLLETKPLSAPWLLGGKEKRRSVFVELVLKHISDERRNCVWVLHSESPIAFKPAQLKKWGLDLEKREKVAVFKRHHEGHDQFLYKPSHCKS